MDEAGTTVITADVNGGDPSVTKTNETACQVEQHVYILYTGLGFLFQNSANWQHG